MAFDGRSNESGKSVMDRYKEVVIGDKVFRLKRLSAQIGSWISYKIIANGMKLDFKEFQEVQDSLLENVEKRTNVNGNTTFTPLYVRESHTWVDKDIEFDLLAVTKLTTESLSFNFESFFEDSGIKEKLAQVGILRS